MVEVRGHAAQRANLRKLGAHTLLFTGPEGVGRRQTARWYASLLNCAAPGEEPCGRCESCRLALTDAHPDLREVAPNTLTTTGKRSRRPEIRIGQLVPREDSEDEPLSRWLEARPHFKRRVGIIDGAHLMNVSAANAFLKLLEEPPAHASIILIAPSSEAVLPTVASRAAPLRFGTLPQDGDHPTARLGRPGDLWRAQVDPDAFAEAEALVTRYVNALSKGLEEALETADALEKVWSRDLPFSLTDLLLARFSSWSPGHYRGAVSALEEAETALASYAAPSLVVQVLTLRLRALLRSGPARQA